MRTTQSDLLYSHFHATCHLLFEMTSSQVFSMCVRMYAQLFVVLNDIHAWLKCAVCQQAIQGSGQQSCRGPRPDAELRHYYDSLVLKYIPCSKLQFWKHRCSKTENLDALQFFGQLTSPLFGAFWLFWGCHSGSFRVELQSCKLSRILAVCRPPQ